MPIKIILNILLFISDKCSGCEYIDDAFVVKFALTSSQINGLGEIEIIFSSRCMSYDWHTMCSV